MRIRIYTDGACSGNPGPGGWGAVIILPNNIKQISGCELDTTNNRMELKAVVESVKLTLQKLTKEIDRIEVVSDSAYVVNAVKQGWLKKWNNNGWKTQTDENVKNKDLWMELTQLIKLQHLVFIKVKGHSGDKHNELVDKIAKGEVQKLKIPRHN